MSRQKLGRRALLLLSGGLDSATAGAIAKASGFRLHAVSFRYGQRHAVELAAARRVARYLGVERHLVVPINLRAFGGSALTDRIPVPKRRSARAMGRGIPITYVPARNTVFLSLALAYAETAGIADLFAGMNALDYSGYPDCRPAYLRAFERMANLATRAGVEGRLRFRLHTPLLRWTKAGIIRRGLALGVDYSITHSCYDPGPRGRPCRACDSCVFRAKGFREAGVRDPALP